MKRRDGLRLGACVLLGSQLPVHVVEAGLVLLQLTRDARAFTVVGVSERLRESLLQLDLLLFCSGDAGSELAVALRRALGASGGRYRLLRSRARTRVATRAR